MTINRTTLFKEPGMIQRDGVDYYSKGPITVTLIEEYANKEAQPFGVVDKFPVNRRIEIKFTPAGEWENLSTLFWANSMTLGTDLFGSQDVPANIYGRVSGKYLIVANTAFTNQPTIAARLKNSLLGEVTLTGLIKNSTDPATAGAYYTAESTVAWPGDGSFSPAAILSQAYTGAWGSAPWDTILTEDGFEIASQVALEPKVVDGLGTVGMILREHSVSAKCTPVGVTRNDVLSALQFGTAFGTVKTANALNITGTGFYARLYAAKLRAPASLNWDLQKYGVGDLTWEATRTIAEGDAQPLLYCGTSAPA